MFSVEILGVNTMHICFRVWGLGFGVWSLRFQVQDAGRMIESLAFSFLGFRDQGHRTHRWSCFRYEGFCSRFFVLKWRVQELRIYLF